VHPQQRINRIDLCALNSSPTSTKSHLLLRFVAGNLHPDHGTIANSRKVFLSETQELFVCILLLAQMAGVLKLGMGARISITNLRQHSDAWRVSVGTRGGLAMRVFKIGRDPFRDRDDTDLMEVRSAV
jgi:hypothetical protein